MLDADLRFVYVNGAYLQAGHKHMMSFAVSSFSTLFLKALAGQTSQLEAQPFQLELEEDGQITEVVWQAT